MSENNGKNCQDKGQITVLHGIVVLSILPRLRISTKQIYTITNPCSTIIIQLVLY